MMIERELIRDEIEQVWSIDRGEIIDNVYYFENGALVPKPEHYDMHVWPPGEADKYTPMLVACFDRGGWFHGIFDGAKLVGAVVLDNKPIGENKDMLQLKFLHVSRKYRRRGLGVRLFELAKAEAHRKGARRFYISATPSENTINFYLARGCVVTDYPDPVLLALEPEDIHLECEV